MSHGDALHILLKISADLPAKRKFLEEVALFPLHPFLHPTIVRYSLNSDYTDPVSLCFSFQMT